MYKEEKEIEYTFKKLCAAFTLVVEVETMRPCGCDRMQPCHKSAWIAFLCL